MMELKNCEPKTNEDWAAVAMFDSIIIEGEDIEYMINSVEDPIDNVQ